MTASWLNKAVAGSRRSLSVLLMAGVLWAALWSATSAVAQSDDAPGSVLTSSGDAYTQLEQLLKEAPSRQVGQAGNEKLQAAFAERFAQAAARANQGKDAALVESLNAQADERLLEYIRISDQSQNIGAGIVEDDARVVQSPFLIRYTVEQPALLTVWLVLVFLMLLMAWVFQRRTSMAIAGGIVLLFAILIPTTAYLVVTEAEGGGEGGSGIVTEESKLREAREQALESLKLAWQAAQTSTNLWQSGKVSYDTAAFLPGETSLSISGDSVRIYQLAPNLAEPANLEDLKFEGKAYYIGDASPKYLAGKNLNGAAVLMDFNSGKRWLQAVQLGAKVILILAPDETMDTGEAVRKLTISPLSVPRFFVPRDAIRQLDVAAIKNSETGADITLTQQEPGRWVNKPVEANWLLIPGSTELAATGTPIDQDPGRQFVHLQAYLDASSFVPELSPGATSAANLVLLNRLLAGFEETPPARPVLISVVNDHANGLHGEQEFSYMAFADSMAIVEELNELQSWIAEHRYTQEVYSEAPDEQKVLEVKSREDFVAGMKVRARSIVLDELTRQRGLVQDEIASIDLAIRDHNWAADRGDPLPMTPEKLSQVEERLAYLIDRKQQYIALMGLFNQYGHVVDYSDLDERGGPNAKARLTNVFEEMAVRAAEQRNALEKSRTQLLDNLALRRRLLSFTSSNDPTADLTPGTSTEQLLAKLFPPLPGVMFLTLDLSFGSDEVGLFDQGQLVDANSRGNRFRSHANQRVAGIARLALDVADELEQQQGVTNRLEDTIRLSRGIPWQAHLGGNFAVPAGIVHQYAVPGVTLTGVRDSRARVFTPDDQLSHLPRENFDKLMAYSESYVPALINTATLGHTIRIRGASLTGAIDLQLREFDKFSLRTPRIPAADVVTLVTIPSFVGLVPADQETESFTFGQVYPWTVKMSNDYGGATYRGRMWDTAAVLAFKYDPDYARMTQALDLGAGETRFPSVLAMPAGITYARKLAVLVDFNKVDLVGLTDPLTLEPALGIELLDAEQKSIPRTFSFAGVAISNAPSGTRKMPLSGDGTASIFIEAEKSFMLKIGSALAINADEENFEGRGFTVERDGRLLNNVVRISAEDMWQLTDSRLETLMSKGVTNEAALNFNTEAGALLQGLDGEAGSSAAQLQVKAEEARGLAFQAYERARSTFQDLIKAVVIFLALVIPFCFFVMKLLTPFTDVNRQLVMFGVIFIIMAILLQLVHPAFAVAETPQVVILAFIILGLALFVGSVLVGRFNATMTQAIEQAQMSDSMDAPQSRLAGVAFMVGVNNMKRRQIRTTLTSLTIVLVTFTMLSVISVGQDVEPAQVRLGSETPYAGMLYTEPGAAEIDPQRLRRLRAHLEGNAQTLARIWAQRLGSFNEYLPYQVRPVEPIEGATAERVLAKVLLGLEVAENGFIAEMPVLAGGRWFSSDDAAEIILSRDAARYLGITPDNMTGRMLEINGRRLKLVGLIDDEAMAQIRDLGGPGLPVLPLLMQAQQSTGESGASSSADLMNTPGIEIARASDVAFVPINIARATGDGGYRTLSVKYPHGDGQLYPTAEAASQAAFDDVRKLIQFQNMRITMGLKESVAQGASVGRLDPGQYTLQSSSSTEVGGVLKVAIPIILAATIILNTMLGSVMERKKEISIYNSIGLNPSHVMVFFLAESLVFGLVGSVAGYLLGQILSVLITRFDLIDLNLNYSSLSVMVVIFLTISTVLLSTVYPAMMAARAAVPSGQRKWSMPAAEGDQISVDFPFSYDGNRVKAVCAYLDDFMKQNSEASTGKFLATRGPRGIVPQDKPDQEDFAQRSVGQTQDMVSADAPDHAYVMVYDIAPAPYDLGVNQKMEIYAYYNARVRAHMLAVHLTRISGDKNSWMTVNQPFLEALRKRLLSWRSQKPETQEAYFHQGEKLFASVGRLPTMDRS